ncbi:Mut7-C ubiquitin/RNAse domain-containing protein [Methylacidiphilum sp. Yel]|uniref:Mut7-C ubiquitin/RNAse domain-containing protein n=1 Tax=Methylacidiphilum sp. Yel TaxID=1847730 RepID=UPI001FC91E2C|nr:Mut7-C ubiquitin/RNAse domain-containing protein [Methylacidiphilum sp. Yel]
MYWATWFGLSMMKNSQSVSMAADNGAKELELTFRFYSLLNDFLPVWKRQKEIKKAFGKHTTLKDAIESFGVPHTEIGLILCNSLPASFEQKVIDGALVSVFPHFKTIDIGKLAPILFERPKQFKFILDVHLGTLARYLRLLGFDTLYNNSYSDEQLADIAYAEERILLTRDPGLLKRKKVKQGYFVRAIEPRLQAIEIIREFHLKEKLSPFGRCLRCNGLLQSVNKIEIKNVVPPKVCETQSSFLKCQHCGKIYWPGSHYHRMKALVLWLKIHAY